MTAAFKVPDAVRLTKDIPEEGLASGALGTVVEVFKGGEAYLVEFCNGEGQTIAMPTVKPADIQPLKKSAAAAS